MGFMGKFQYIRLSRKNMEPGRQILAKAEYALGIFDIGPTVVFERHKNLLGL